MTAASCRRSRSFRPDFLLISAGFDADYRDPLAQLNWRPDDFAWVTGRLMEVAERRCGDRIVSLLEGGYDREGLADRAWPRMLRRADGKEPWLTPSNDDVKAMSFEAALAELEGIVAKLESGKAPLAESIAIYERGEALKAHCEGAAEGGRSADRKDHAVAGGKPSGPSRSTLACFTAQDGIRLAVDAGDVDKRFSR